MRLHTRLVAFFRQQHRPNCGLRLTPMISPLEAKPSGHFLADAAYRAFFGEAQTTRPVEITRTSQRYAIAWDKSDLEAGSFFKCMEKPFSNPF